MNQQSIQHEGMNFYYMKQGDHVSLTGADRLGGFVCLPQIIEGLPVRVIEKKAFLGQSSLRELTVGPYVNKVMEWSFAQCPNLEKIVFQSKADSLQMEKGAFEGNPKLREICFEGEGMQDMAVLLAAAANRLKAEYLLIDLTRGSREWFAKWDKRLSDFLLENDEEGYGSLALCGEEDIMLDLGQFMSEKREQKAALCLIRLRFDKELTEPMRQTFTDYLLRHTKGCGGEEAWKVLLKEFIIDISYGRLFAEIGGVNEKNIEEILLDLGGDYAEAKGYFLKYKQEHFAKKDAFAAFAL